MSTPPPSIPPRQRRPRPSSKRPSSTPPPGPAANPAPNPIATPKGAAAPNPTPAQPPRQQPDVILPRRTVMPPAARDASASPGSHDSSVPPAVNPPSYAPRNRHPQPAAIRPASKSSTPYAAPQATRLMQEYPSAPRQSQTAPPPPAGPTRPKRKRRRIWPWAFLLVVVMVIGWPLWLLYYTNSNLHHVEALVPGPAAPGVTYLVAGSDERPDGWNEDGIEGGRSDSIILIHKADNGQTSMVSLPRDTYVDIPGYGWNKLNAAFSFGGAPLLVETVQGMTGLTMDHYVQINMDGVAELVDAVGGVEMCMDMDANEPHSGLVWEAGCRTADGATALALARMRYDDPRGDLGRAERQRELMSKVAGEAISWGTIFNPAEQLRLSRAGTNTLFTDQTMNVFDVARLLLTFRTAGNLSGTPPLWSTSEMTEVGAVVLLDEDQAPGFFQKMAEGQLTEADFESEF